MVCLVKEIFIVFGATHFACVHEFRYFTLCKEGVAPRQAVRGEGHGDVVKDNIAFVKLVFRGEGKDLDRTITIPIERLSPSGLQEESQ